MIERITNDEELVQALFIIHKAYEKRDIELGIKNNNHVHSKMTYEELKKLYDENVEMYLYYDNNNIVGFVSIKINEDSIKIKDIVVLPSYQNKGIGNKLLDFVKSKTVEYNKNKIILGMINKNIKLKNWYEKNNFVCVKIVKYEESQNEIAYLEYNIK